MSALRHTRKIGELLAEGDIAEAKQIHTEHVDAEFERAKAGEIICLTDLFAAKEQIDLAIIERRR